MLTAAIVAESQLCLIDCDCDWQKLGSIVWPLVLSRLRSLCKPAAGRKKRENKKKKKKRHEEDIGSWVFGVEPLSGCRQPIPLQQLSGLIAPKKKGRKGGEINKLSTESVIYRRCVVKKKKKKLNKFLLCGPSSLLPSLPLVFQQCCIL